MKKVLSIFLALLIMTTVLSLPASAKGATTKEIDVIFLVDSSGSMRKSDPGMIRLEAIKLFADLCWLGSTKIGFVLFGDEILYSQEPIAVNTEQDREDIKKKVDGLTELKGYTDIGLAVKYTTEMFAKDEYSGNGKFIVFLSDGKTVIGKKDSGRTLEASNIDLEEGIINARNEGVPIYTIGLNPEGDVDEEGLNYISAETGADETYMTNSAGDLSEILSDIYVRHTGAESKGLDNYVSDGEYHDTSFPIADSTVVEANLVITHTEKPDDIQLFGPGGEQVLFDGTAADISWQQGYTLVKAFHPAVGNWRLSVKSKSETKVVISYILTRDYGLKLSFVTDKPVGADATVKFTALLTDPNENAIIDEGLLSALIGKVIVTENASGKSTDVSLDYDEEGIFKGEYKLPSDSDYSFQANFFNSNIDIRGDILTVALGEEGYLEPEGPLKLILIIAGGVLVLAIIVILIIKHFKENIRMWSGRLLVSVNLGGMPEPPAAYDFAKKIPGKRQVMLSDVMKALFEGRSAADALPRSLTSGIKITMTESGDVRVSKVNGLEYSGGITLGKNVIISNANKVTLKYKDKAGSTAIVVIQYQRT